MMRGVRLLAGAIMLAPSIVFGQAAGAPGLAVPAPQETPANPALQARQDQLQTAIVKRDAPALRALIRSGMDLNFDFNDLLPRGRTSESPLTLAIYRGHLDMARLLLEGGADARRKDGDGRPPIHRARSAEAVRLLAEFGADTNALDGNGRTAAYRALERGDLAAIDMLLANGARLDADPKGTDLLVRAIDTGHPEMIDALLDRGVDPRSPPTQALFLLIDGGDTGRARRLIQRGADVNARKDREWVLGRALFRQRWEIADALIDAGAEVKFAGLGACGGLFTDCPPIQFARSASFNPAMLARLKAKGLDLDAAAKDGHTTLTSLIVEQPMAIRAIGSSTMSSVAQNAVTGETVTRTTQAPVPSNVIPAPENVARAKALLELGADPNRKLQDMTPLMLAIGLPGKPKEMAEMLFSFGARVAFEETISKPRPDDRPVIGSLGRSQIILNDQGILTGMKMGPLTWTALHNRPDIALRLLERERKVTRADRDLLYFAAAAGQWDLVIGALAFTREVDAADRADVTPLMMAAYAGNSAAVRALLAAGAKVNARSARDWPPFFEADWRAALSGHPSRPPLVGGYTALRAAKERGHVEVTRILVDAGGKE